VEVQLKKYIKVVKISTPQCFIWLRSGPQALPPGLSCLSPAPTYLFMFLFCFLVPFSFYVSFLFLLYLILPISVTFFSISYFLSLYLFSINYISPCLSLPLISSILHSVSFSLFSFCFYLDQCVSASPLSLLF